MRTYLIGTAFLAMLLFIFLMSEATYEGVPLHRSALASSAGYSLKETAVSEMVILPERDYNEVEALKIISTLSRLPKPLLEKANEEEIKIILFEGKLTDQHSAAHLRGLSPRGYGNAVTWDDVPGIGGSKLVLVKIGSSEKGNGHGSVNLELHEFAHTLENYIFNDPQSEKVIMKSWQTEAKDLFPRKPYFLDYREEYFAESFAYYFFSIGTREKLEIYAPSMYRFFSNMEEEV